MMSLCKSPMRGLIWFAPVLIVVVFSMGQGCPTSAPNSGGSSNTGGECATCGVTAESAMLEFVWGLDANNVYCGGLEGICKWTDGQWCSIMSSGILWSDAMWGTSSQNLYASGTDSGGGAVYRYDGAEWEKVASAAAITSLGGIWGSSTSDIFAVGGDDQSAGSIIHYDGTKWSYQTNDLYGSFSDVWGTSATNVWAVGGTLAHAGTEETNVGVVYHYDGSAWQHVAIAGRSLSGIWGSSAQDIFAVGSSDTGPAIIHYDGSKWSWMSSLTTESLMDVYGTSSTNVWAVGWEGTLLHYNGEGWTEIASTTEAHLRSVWTCRAEDLYISGRGRGSEFFGNAVVKRLTVSP